MLLQIQRQILDTSDLSEEEKADIRTTMQIFSMFDSDGDGSISVDELFAALGQEQGQSTTAEEVLVSGRVNRPLSLAGPTN